ncbi:XrtA/PEP-CTERM system-associated ATPase [Sphingomonas sp. R86521]|uniref:XrtA/PEP-CTERM system-associated ATPase n=1 Tax=Sphingomonas sp. R86521 TaxID=3093860 RepID=UPI0036D260F2
MYDEHYGLTGRPFQLTPDPKFWFETATHRKAMAYLGYGLAQGEGFIVITGDIGAGKTTLVGHLMDTIDHKALNAIKIVSTAIEAEDLLRIVATDLGVNPAGLEKAELLTAIERGLHAVARTGRRTLLIVDEAQALPVSALEELRMLSNFQAGGQALLQILLLGQPDFRDRLHGSDRLEQLRQRIIAIHHLDPMEEHEVSEYIAHRLAVVGWTGNPDFQDDSFAALYRGSGGVPRRLNLLAGRVMLHASIEDLTLIDEAVVNAVIGDLDADLPTLALTTPDEPETAPVASTPEATPAVRAAPAVDTELTARVAELEARVEQQDAALRRVLTLLVDWVESDSAKPDYAPIRGVANWHDAA